MLGSENGHEVGDDEDTAVWSAGWSAGVVSRRLSQRNMVREPSSQDRARAAMYAHCRALWQQQAPGNKQPAPA